MVNYTSGGGWLSYSPPPAPSLLVLSTPRALRALKQQTWSSCTYISQATRHQRNNTDIRHTHNYAIVHVNLHPFLSSLMVILEDGPSALKIHPLTVLSNTFLMDFLCKPFDFPFPWAVRTNTDEPFWYVPSKLMINVMRTSYEAGEGGLSSVAHCAILIITQKCVPVV